MAHDLEVLSHVLEDFGNVLAEATKLATTIGTSAGALMHDLLAWQVLGQRFAHRLLGRLGRGRVRRRHLRLRGLQLFEPQLELLDLARELLGGATELQPAQLRNQ